MARKSTLLGGWITVTLLFAGVARSGEQEGLHLRFSLGDRPFTVTVSGRIVDAETGKPIPGSLVCGFIFLNHLRAQRGPESFDYCPQAEARSAEDGTYRLEFVTPLTTSGAGKVCIHTGAPGHETRHRWVRPQVTREHTRLTDVELRLGPGKLVKGKVVDESQRPIQDARVRVQDGRSGAVSFFGALGEARSDENGQFQVWCSTDREVIGSDPWLRISKRGYGTGFFWDVLAKEDMGTLVVPQGGTITGRVVDSQGQGVAGCEVVARDFWPNELDKTATAADGSYRLQGIPEQKTLVDFYLRKNRQEPPTELISVTVYARPEAGMNLRDAPQCEVIAKDGQTVKAPDFALGADMSVAGKLVPSRTTPQLEGLMVRLDSSWDHMVTADAEGNFRFPSVPPGKHRLTAYLPTNLRGDRGIGRTKIDVEPGKPIADVTIPLDLLAEVRVQFVDLEGNPLQAVTAGATWTKTGQGFWTEGTKSDEDGRAVVYLDPGRVQYVRGFDHSDHALIAEGYEQVQPKAGEVIENLRITMVPPANLRGRLTAAEEIPFAERRFSCRLEYADGMQKEEQLRVDASGVFQLAGLQPGVVRLAIETVPADLLGSISEPTEITPGETKDVGPIRLAPKKAHTSTKQGMIELVEDFFRHNFRDVTSRKTIEWGEVVKDDKGNSSIRYKYEATIWDRDKLVMNQIFTFDPNGKYVSYKNVEGFPKKL